MYVDVETLNSFYKTDIGFRVSETLKLELDSRNLFCRKALVASFGYSLPYLPKFLSLNHQIFVFMPARQGIFEWSENKNCCKLLMEDYIFPLKNNIIDDFLLIHMLEFSQNAELMLKEIWRVLKPEGRLIIIVPNRKGIWSFYEHTPFGHGVPYSRMQLQNLLKKTNFTLENLQESLYFFPKKNKVLHLLSRFHMSLSTTQFDYFGGVLLVEAKKNVYKPVFIQEKNKKNFFVSDLGYESLS